MKTNEDLVKEWRLEEDKFKKEMIYKELFKNVEMLLNKIISKKSVNDVSYDLLMYQAQVGLMEALRKWDESKNIKFSTYLYNWVLKYVLATCSEEQTKVIRIPDQLRQDILKQRDNKYLKEGKIALGVDYYEVGDDFGEYDKEINQELKMIEESLNRLYNSRKISKIDYVSFNKGYKPSNDIHVKIVKLIKEDLKSQRYI